MIKVSKYFLTLLVGLLIVISVSADDLGTGKGGKFKKDTFSKDNFNKSGEGLTPPAPTDGSGGYEVPIGGGIYLLVLGGLAYFVIRPRSRRKSG